MTKNKRTVWYMSVASVVLALLICLSCVLVPNKTKAQAQTYSLDDDLHKQTKIYSSSFSEDYYVGCEDYSNYTSVDPSITVFTPGLRCTPSAFSNENFNFAYNDNSIIAAICKKLNNDVDIYYAKCTDKTDLQQFELYKLDIYDYEREGKETAHIGDITKHIILLFESSIRDASNQDVYEQFEYVVDSISLQYKELAGVLPRLNLVGHSRGGLTNIQYATEHPYNVASIFSMGTPYSGSTLGQADVVLQMLGYMKQDGTYASMGAEDIMNPEVELKIRDNWNAAYNHYLDANINVVALGSMASLSMVRAFAHDLLNDEEYSKYVEDVIGVIDFIISCWEDYPILEPLTLLFVDGLAQVLDLFGVDLMKVVGDVFDKEAFKSITNEELHEICMLVNYINGEIVIMDDIFIDTNSQ